MSGPADELLPCPFCGGDPMPGYSSVLGEPAYHIHCHQGECPAWPNVQGETEAEAIAAWNARAALRQPAPDAGDMQGLVERLLKKRVQGDLNPVTGFGRVMIPDPDCVEAVAAIQSLTAQNAYLVRMIRDGAQRETIIAANFTKAEADLKAERDNATSYAVGIAKYGLVREAEVLALTAQLAATATASGEHLKNLGAERAKVAELVEGLKRIELLSTNHGGWFEQNPFNEYTKLGGIARDLIERMK